MPASAVKSGPRGTVYSPPGPPPWRITARLSTYKAFESIFGEADEGSVRKYVKNFIKERGDGFITGKNWRNWKEDVGTLGDQLAAKYWPDLVDKEYLCYVLEKYVTLIRVHANKYDVQKKSPSREASTPDCRGTSQTPTKHSDYEQDDTEEAAECTSNAGSTSAASTGTTTVTDPPDTGLDNFIEKVAVRVERRIMRQVNWVTEREAEKVDNMIRTAERKIDKLKKDVQKLKAGSGSANPSPKTSGEQAADSSL
ncbi:MAG: hypothetical protein M1840_000935 [Geoglossum simile]|nr:MAG: hypothetical protein M1840_000935 [Geoglossum simile]